MSPETISERARAIRLSRKELAGLAGRSEKSLGQILNGRVGGLNTSVEAIRDAVLTEEFRLRDYLNALHPVTTPQMEKAS